MFEQVTDIIQKTAEIDDLELAYALDLWAITLLAQVIDPTLPFHHVSGVWKRKEHPEEHRCIVDAKTALYAPQHLLRAPPFFVSHYAILR